MSKTTKWKCMLTKEMVNFRTMETASAPPKKRRLTVNVSEKNKMTLVSKQLQVTRAESKGEKNSKSINSSVDLPITLNSNKIIKKISSENLDCDYYRLLDKKSADSLFKQCENEIEYFSGDLAKVKVFGKWFDIPRRQVAYGDTGLTYTYSGITVPALPWPPFLKDVRDHLQAVTGVYFSFVLVNRYADGDDYIGEHRDDEKDLNKLSPIASISLGQTRVFKFRHKDSRGKNAKRKIEPVCLDLTHGTLLMMNYPTNQYWYHSLPKRHNVKLARINLTFRDIKQKI